MNLLIGICGLTLAYIAGACAGHYTWASTTLALFGGLLIGHLASKAGREP